MSIRTIDIRELTEQGPSELGPIIASCPVIRVDTHYDHPSVDVQLPRDFVLPETPKDVALYADGKYFGSLILDKEGFKIHPDYPYTSPFFKIEIASQNECTGISSVYEMTGEILPDDTLIFHHERTLGPDAG